jgi:hypothetical protein
MSNHRPLDYETPPSGPKPHWENREPSDSWILAVTLGVGLVAMFLLGYLGK